MGRNSRLRKERKRQKKIDQKKNRIEDVLFVETLTGRLKSIEQLEVSDEEKSLLRKEYYKEGLLLDLRIIQKFLSETFY